MFSFKLSFHVRKQKEVVQSKVWWGGDGERVHAITHSRPCGQARCRGRTPTPYCATHPQLREFSSKKQINIVFTFHCSLIWLDLWIVSVAPAFITSNYFWKNIRVIFCYWSLVSTRGTNFATTRCIFNSSLNCIDRNSRTLQSNQEVHQLFYDDLLWSFHEFLQCFLPFCSSRVTQNQAGLQLTFHHFWNEKTTHKLVTCVYPIASAL